MNHTLVLSLLRLFVVLMMLNGVSGFVIGKRNIARSVTVIIPTIVSFTSTIGSLRILFFNIISTAFSIVVAGSGVMSGYCFVLMTSRG